MADDVPFSWMREVGGVFRLGSGVLGKSVIGLGLLVVVGGIAITHLHSDWAILTIFGAVVLAFFVWFFPVLSFCKKHPDAALLDGAEWTGYQRDRVAAKGYTPLPNDFEHQQLAPGTDSGIIQIGAGSEPK
ncbi:hypothetical protein JAO29_03910 [Edaphobacter sp. HDX4]|uniref:hypothetical protein n=1 Tax=Edaphobacter sp. HDX4 TaxID=2794064 RepID=UPI002FE64C10